jgi:hypothetical protein
MVKIPHFFLSVLTSSGAENKGYSGTSMWAIFHVRLNPTLLEGNIDVNICTEMKLN